jgi:GT2 family glycosyltransferase
MEINHAAWNLCNTIMPAAALKARGFDETFLWAEDTELFSYLRSQGYRFEKREIAPVVHAADPDSPKAVSRAFRYGIYWMRIRNRYPDAVEPVPFSWLMRRLLIVILQTLGMIVGWAYAIKDRRLRTRESD